MGQLAGGHYQLSHSQAGEYILSYQYDPEAVAAFAHGLRQPFGAHSSLLGGVEGVHSPLVDQHLAPLPPAQGMGRVPEQGPKLHVLKRAGPIFEP